MTRERDGGVASDGTHRTSGDDGDDARVVLTTLTGWRLPVASAYRREPALPEAERGADYAAGYDDRTLFYDAVAVDGGAAVLFTAPRFGRLWPVFRDGLRIGGRRPRLLRRLTSGRCQQVVVPRRGDAPVTIEIEGAEIPVTVRRGLADAAAGLNAAVAMNRDNRLDWIADWARWHVDAHGLQAVAIIDNGSTLYGPAEIGAALAAVDGLRRVTVVSAPFPYGAAFHAGGRLVRLKFLQTAMLNLARRDFFARARAVLNADIDELVRPLTGQTVFDAAHRSRLGTLRLGGSWVFPEDGATLPVAHGDNRYRADPDRPCASKWCARPRGLLSRLGWNVHNVGQNWGRRVAPDPRFAILHCAGTTTGWKPASRRFDAPAALRADDELAREYARRLPARPAPTDRETATA